MAVITDKMGMLLVAYAQFFEKSFLNPDLALTPFTSSCNVLHECIFVMLCLFISIWLDVLAMLKI